MRIGTVLSFNKNASVGLIKDTNDQNIRFRHCATEKIPSRGMIVTFEIEHFEGQLLAVNVNVLILRGRPILTDVG